MQGKDKTCTIVFRSQLKQLLMLHGVFNNTLVTDRYDTVRLKEYRKKKWKSKLHDRELYVHQKGRCIAYTELDLTVYE